MKEENATAPLISIILPCRNEESAIAACLTQIQNCLLNSQLSYEIIVSDSSSDRSPDIARDFPVVLVKHDKEGYGTAYLEGFKAVRGRFLFLADADGTYNFAEIPRFIEHLKNGNDLVIGNRFGGTIYPGAMPWHHRHIGNPLLSALFRIMFKSAVTDVHCGMRAISRESLERLNLKTSGMEFASEMLVEAERNKLRIKQLPIDYHARIGKSKLRTFSDARRHLEYMYQAYTQS